MTNSAAKTPTPRRYADETPRADALVHGALGGSARIERRPDFRLLPGQAAAHADRLRTGRRLRYLRPASGGIPAPAHPRPPDDRAAEHAGRPHLPSCPTPC